MPARSPPETLVYDPTTEQWVALSPNAELMAVIFPKKKKLILKHKEIKPLTNPTRTRSRSRWMTC